MLLKKIVSDETQIQIQKVLDKIIEDCVREDLPTLSQEEQQRIKLDIERRIGKYVDSVYESIENPIIRSSYLEQSLVDESIYQFHKLASKQSFGVVEQPRVLPRDIVTEKQLTRRKKQTGSANVTQQARLMQEGTFVFL